MVALFSLELDFPGSTPPILEGFGNLSGRFLDIFWYLMSCKFHHGFLFDFTMDFDGFRYPLDKQK